MRYCSDNPFTNSINIAVCLLGSTKSSTSYVVISTPIDRAADNNKDVFSITALLSVSLYLSICSASNCVSIHQGVVLNSLKQDKSATKSVFRISVRAWSKRLMS
eukprot:207590_1